MKDVTEIELVLFNFGRRTDARKKLHITQILILGLFTSIEQPEDVYRKYLGRC